MRAEPACLGPGALASAVGLLVATLLLVLSVTPPARAVAAPPGDESRGAPVDRELASIGIRRSAKPLRRPRSTGRPPPGFRLSAREAIDIASRDGKVRAERSRHKRFQARAFLRGGDGWQVSYFADGAERVQVYVDDRSGRRTESWTGAAVDVMMARGHEGAFAGKLNAPYVWLPLCLLFLLPFVDPRRPFRLLHLDLLVLLSFGVSHYFFNRAQIDVSVALVYPVLGYLFVRMLVAGFARREARGPLVPVAPPMLLAVGIVALAAFRIGLNVVDSQVIDIGYAGVIGADRLVHGQELYDGSFPQIRGDTYGPLNYLAYVPFEQLLPWSGSYDDLPAAHAASIAFDLLAIAALLLLGRRLRPGHDGRVLGLALAYAWVSYPYTAFALQSNGNDTLVAALVVLSLAALGAPALRGALLGAAGAVKLAPLALVPLFAFATDTRRVRTAALVAGAAALVVVLTALPFVPDGGVRELYDRTLGYQAGRNSPFNIWGLEPLIEPLQGVARVGAVLFAVAVAFLARGKAPEQIAALGAAVLIALQVGVTHWFYLYVVWFAPLVLIAAFAPYRTGSPSRVPASAAPAAIAEPASG
jgi:Glycosyltransferase family 87